MSEPDNGPLLGFDSKNIPPVSPGLREFQPLSGPALPTYDPSFHKNYPTVDFATRPSGIGENIKDFLRSPPPDPVDPGVPLKPYTISTITTAQLNHLRDKVDGYLNGLPKDENLQPLLERKVDGLAKDHLLNSKMVRDLGRKAVGALGTIEIPADDHPASEDVDTAIEDYNGKHPDAPVEGPRHLFLAEKIPTLNSSLGIMVLKESDAERSTELRLPIIAHELRHEHQMMTGQFQLRTYSPEQHQRWAAPGLPAICAGEGVGTEDVSRVVPSGLTASLTAISWLPIEWRTAALNAGTFADRALNLPQTLGAYAKLEQAPGCKEEVAKVNGSLDKALSVLNLDQQAAMRGLELDADRAAAVTYGNKAMADALIAATKGTIDRKIDGIEEKFDHPSLNSRLKALGCEPLAPDDQESAICGPLPPKPESPSARQR